MKNTNKKYLIITICSLLLFIFISILSLKDRLISIDQAIISWFTESSSSFVVTLMEAITKIGSGEFILILSLIIGLCLSVYKKWGYVIFLFVLTSGGIALNFFLKVLFQRERPGEMSVIEVFGYSLEIASYSFPSGHTMRSVILFTFLIFLCYRLIRNSLQVITFSSLFIFMIISVALSRIIVGAHFPSDIFAAITISLSWFYFCLIAFQSFFRNKFVI
ncbi:phosphatase PAP2 family protein [Alkalihalobacillus sp. MEB130]|uniref:phosphatase PAP2 family protein n=1 Tax=Alkalihalobacillus sp. MEB130 TaxID=2976704 RepID=UPI0028E01BE2|nr:phosphatase PAP2 family protein [Alkalihalobacillus sp. MEB130]MDT8861402.1 phosphatase PAP2 family protein [Alkalihalobacillus sp. MEB130]